MDFILLDFIFYHINIINQYYPCINTCINYELNIIYITKLNEKVFEFYNVNSIRYIPYCICCTIQYTIVDNKVDNKVDI